MQIKEIDSKTLADWLASDNPPVLVDVRNADEMAQAAIAGAYPLPLPVLPLRISDVPKDKEVVIYCRSGARSGQACFMLMNMHGYDKVHNLRGGILDWVNKGFPVQPLIIQA